jgi:predicted phage terminase large subunit-like protein
VGRDQFQYWTERPATFDVVIQSWDFATNKKPGSWVVGQVWGKRGSEYWLLDQTRGRWSFIESRQAVLSLSAKWPEAVAKVIEAKANGPAIMSDLGGLIDGLTPWPPPGMAMSDKQTRFLGVSPLIVAGNVFVPTPSVAPWIHDYLEELTAFPGEPNDQVDTTSQALQYLRDVKPKAPFVMRGGWK